MRAAISMRLQQTTLALGTAILGGCNADTAARMEVPPHSQLSSLSAEFTLTQPAPADVALIPAIAFVQGETYTLVQPTFDGEAPGSLTVHLDAPPERVVPWRILLDAEPRAVLGLFATISATREAELAKRVWLSPGGRCDHLSDGTTACVLDASWCLPDQTACYVEHYNCSHEGWNDTINDTHSYQESWQYSRALFNVDTLSRLVLADGCTLLGTEGDASLKEPVESYLAFAENYWLLHLTTHAPAGSVISYLMGESEAIPAGYSVIELTRFEESAAQTDTRVACEQAARDEAATQVGNARNVSLSDADFDLETCTQGISICDEAITAALRARADRNCPFDGYTAQRVDEADLTTLDLTFGDAPVFPW